jgi:surface protein
MQYMFNSCSSLKTVTVNNKFKFLSDGRLPSGTGTNEAGTTGCWYYWDENGILQLIHPSVMNPKVDAGNESTVTYYAEKPETDDSTIAYAVLYSKTTTVNQLTGEILSTGDGTGGEESSEDGEGDESTYAAESGEEESGDTITYEEGTLVFRRGNPAADKELAAQGVCEVFEDIETTQYKIAYEDIMAVLCGDYECDEDEFETAYATALAKVINDSVIPGWIEINENLDFIFRGTKVIFETTIRPVSTVAWFAGYPQGTLDLSVKDLSNGEVLVECGLDTSEVTDMSFMFIYSSLTSLKLRAFDTGRVTNMGWMFGVCTNLEELEVDTWNVEKVTNMVLMFEQCSMESLDLSNWSTDSLENSSYMFMACKKLSNLNISMFNTTKVKDRYLSYMFMDNKNLQQLTIGADYTGYLPEIRSASEDGSAYWYWKGEDGNYYKITGQSSVESLGITSTTTFRTSKPDGVEEEDILSFDKAEVDDEDAADEDEHETDADAPDTGTPIADTGDAQQDEE